MSFDVIAGAMPTLQTMKNRRRWRRAGRRGVTFSPAQYAALKTLAHKEGMSMSALIAARLGLPDAPTRRAFQEISEDIKRQAVDLYLAGQTLKEASAHVGIGASTLSDYMIRMGIPRRHSSRSKK